MPVSQKNTSETARRQAQILGIHLDITDKDRVLAKIAARIKNSGLKKVFLVTTPNPEIVLAADSDSKLHDILQGADISLPDGVGLKLGYWGLNIIKGRELFEALVSLSASNGWKIVLIGGDSTPDAAKVLKQRYANLKVQAFIGPKLDNNAEVVTQIDSKLQQDLVDKIAKYTPDILFVGFGAPKQEKWADKNKEKLHAKVIMVVGGTFDYIAGARGAVPSVMSSLGLEWLYRLLKGETSLQRIINAAVVFPLKVIYKAFLSS